MIATEKENTQVNKPKNQIKKENKPIIPYPTCLIPIPILPVCSNPKTKEKLQMTSGESARKDKTDPSKTQQYAATDYPFLFPIV